MSPIFIPAQLQIELLFFLLPRASATDTTPAITSRSGSIMIFKMEKRTSLGWEVEIVWILFYLCMIFMSSRKRKFIMA